jgi:hypothetical protein
MPKLTGACSAAGYLVVNIMYSSEFIDVEDVNVRARAGGQHLKKVPAFLGHCSIK